MMPKAKQPGPIDEHWQSIADFFRLKGRSDAEIAVFRMAFYLGAQFVLTNARTAMSLLLMASEVREFQRECGLDEVDEVRVS